MPGEKIELTRRNVLVGVSLIGVVGTSVGLGTQALLSDDESFGNNAVTAGSLNLRVSARVVEASRYFAKNGAGRMLVGERATVDGDPVIGIRVEDVKPGDWAIVCLEITVQGNPGYIQLTADDVVQYENGRTEPEADSDGTGGGSLGLPLDGEARGELHEALDIAVYQQYDGTVTSDDPRDYLSDSSGLQGTGGTAFDRLISGIVLGGDSPTAVGPGSPVTRYLLFNLPASAGNEVQSDAVEFDLVIQTEQVRNNPNPFDAGPTQSARLLATNPTSGAYFGADAALAAGTLAISADGFDAKGTNSGAVYVFEGEDWTRTGPLTPADAGTGQLFGEAVAVEGDTLVVGASGDDENGTNAGAAYLFDGSGGSWSQSAKLTGGDTTAGDSFGQDVAVSGDRAVVGADGESTAGTEAGAVYVFERDSTGWSETAKLTAGDAGTEDYFGSRVALESNTLVAGAYGDDENGSNSGAAYVFDRSNGSWSQTAKLEPTSLSASDFFGSSVAVDGQRTLVGAFGTDRGGNPFAGAAYVYDARKGYDSATQLTPPLPSAGEFFGWEVDIDDGSAIVGAYGANNETGAAYVFDESGGWGLQTTLLPEEVTTGDRFGVAVGIDAETVAVTADGTDVVGPNTGRGYAFTGGEDDA